MFKKLFEKGLISLIAFGQKQQMKRADRPGRRGQHPKHQGCVWATFTVNDEVPESLRNGVFASPHSYDAVIRFSNGAQFDDRIADVHGMAIKLLDVPGEKLLGDEKNASTHDFILADHPVFFARNLVHMMKFASAIKKKVPHEEIYKTHPAFRGFFHDAADNPLAASYWSQTPYRCGRQIVRYIVKPVGDNSVHSDRKSEDFLKEAMSVRLAPGQPDASFDFFMQTAPDDDSKWVDDPSLAWDESTSPPVQIASITIAAQPFDTDEQQSFCENLSFTPWRCLADHQPIGQINRARRLVYQASSKLRHQVRNAPRQEPTIADRPERIAAPV